VSIQLAFRSRCAGRIFHRRPRPGDLWHFLKWRELPQNQVSE